MSYLVVKVGGRALLSNMDAILRDLARHTSSSKIILVHGGGDVVTAYSKRLGIEPRIVLHPSGMKSRYTSREELEVYVMVMAGKLNKEIVSKLVALRVKAIGLSGADAGILKARRKERIIIINERGRRQVIEGGYTGSIYMVAADMIEKLLEIVDVLVIAPIAVSDKGELLNVDGDQAALKIAEAIKPEALILLSDVPGVILDGRVIDDIDADAVEDLVDKIGPGMNRKILAASRAVKSGVGRVVISSGLIEEPITGALKGGGTVIHGQG
ncbi:MAG: [LysW]-aminoadipate/[LysW]-glutamate kinase [Desulfurococcales archaeon]|nr:[LysW]-aminoadipate/[LysW]-glutamate kinase [Desulfurococcales archaeon]